MDFRCTSLIYAHMDVPNGTYQYKFVDDCCCTAPELWFYNPYKPTITTAEGYINNVMTVGETVRGIKCEECDDVAEYNVHTGSICVKCIIVNYAGLYDTFIAPHL